MWVRFPAGPIPEDLKFQGESVVLIQQYKLSGLSDETLKTEVPCTGSYPQACKRSQTVCRKSRGLPRLYWTSQFFQIIVNICVLLNVSVCHIIYKVTCRGWFSLAAVCTYIVCCVLTNECNIHPSQEETIWAISWSHSKWQKVTLWSRSLNI